MLDLRLAVSAALSTAFLDAWIGALSGVRTLSFLVSSAAATLLVSLPLFVAASAAPSRVRLRPTGENVASLRTALVALLGSFIVLAQLSELAPPSVSPWMLWKWALVLLLALAFAGLAFVASAVGAEPTAAGRTRALGLAVPLILGQTALLAWLCGGRRVPLASLAGFLAVYFVAVVATVRIVRRPGVRARSLPILVVIALSVVTGGLWGVLTGTRGAGDVRATQPAELPVNSVILLTIDTLRADAVSALGPGRTRTPHIDSLAADGVLFTQARTASPWTLPAVASMMTGLLPSVHQATRRTLRLDEGLVTLAEMLREAGYATAAFGNNVLLRSEAGLAQGFGEYFFYPRAAAPGSSIGARILRRALPGRFGLADPDTAQLTDAAIDWLTSNAERSFFLWVHYLDPHEPYGPPASYLPGDPPSARIGTLFNEGYKIRDGRLAPSVEEREWLRKLYDAEVRYVDDSVGRLLEHLRALGLYDPSLIVLTSDHGEEFWEHGGHGHGHSLYDEVLRVPLIVKPPHASVTNRVSLTVSTQDLFPTILEICGVKTSEEMTRSLVPTWHADAGPVPRAIVQEPRSRPPMLSMEPLYYEDRVSLIDHGFKYIRRLNPEEEELFELEKDPGELHSIAAEADEYLPVARAALDHETERAGQLARRLVPESPEPLLLDDQTRRMLRALGYVR